MKAFSLKTPVVSTATPGGEIQCYSIKEPVREMVICVCKKPN